MFKWAQQAMANVAGTKEPIYGPSAVKSVAEQAKTTPYTEVTRENLKWRKMDTTSVETQCFYFLGDNGLVGFAQIIYSNVAGIHTTCQFNSKVFYLDGKKPHLWCTSPLKDLDFSEDMTSFYAQDCAVELSADGKTYTIKSMNNKKSLVNLTLTRTAPGFMAGTDGKTLYGTDFKNPWGSMEHAFWPRCVGEGTITTPEGPIEFKGRAFFVKALQGMKPHHAAAQWNFLTFQAPNVSAVMMEFTTPPSYGATVVTVGGIAKDGEIITAGAQTPVVHSKTKVDPETKWSAPQTVKFAWNGKSKDGKPVAAVLEGDLEDHLDRMDIMSEVPAFVKQIVGATVGTKPYIYQYTPTKQKLSLKLKIGEEPEIVEQGQIFSEATFISSTTEE